MRLSLAHVTNSHQLPAHQKAARKVFGNGTYRKSDKGTHSKRIVPGGKPTGANYHP